MRSATHLVKRGPVFYYRARVPADIKDEYRARYGKSVIVESLHTKDRAEARARTFERSAQLEREFQRIRGSHAGTLTPGLRTYLSDADIEHICAYHRAQLLTWDRAERVAGMSEHSADVAGDLYGEWVKKLAPALARGDTSVTRDALDRALTQLGLDVVRDTSSFRQLEYAFLETEVAAWNAVMQRQRGEVVVSPPVPGPRVSISDVVDYWAKQTEPRPATEADFRHVFRKFREVFPVLCGGRRSEEARHRVSRPPCLHRARSQDRCATPESLACSIPNRCGQRPRRIQPR